MLVVICLQQGCLIFLFIGPSGQFLKRSQARIAMSQLIKHTINTHTFNGPLSGTTGVSRHQKGKTNLDFTEARDSGWQ